MTLMQLHQFFQNEQKQELTLDELRSMNDKFKDIHPTQPCVSFDLFNDLLFSMLNTIFNAELSTQYQVNWEIIFSNILRIGYDKTIDRLLCELLT